MAAENSQESSAKTLQILAPTAGTVVPIDQVPDPVFSTKAVGDGFGVSNPPTGDFVAPVSGKITMLAKSGHAVGIRTEEGVELLVHIGIDTVELEGKPFTWQVSKGDEVTAGQVLGQVDTEVIVEAEKDTTVIVVVTNSRKKIEDLDVVTTDVSAGDVAVTATLKQADADKTAKKASENEDSGKAGAAAGAAAGAGAGAAGAAVASSQDSESSSASEAAGEETVAKQRPAELEGYDALAWDILNEIGGKSNIRSVTHCITRVRFYLKDEGKANDDAIRELDGVIDVVKAGGQYQVVIGPAVEDVYNAIMGQLGGDIATDEESVEEVERPTTAWGWVKYGFSSLIGVITGSMIPIIGLLAAAGIIKGILSLLITFDVTDNTTDTYQIINAMSDAVFLFLPIFVGFTAARRLGSDPIIVAIVGGVLTYPAILEMADSDADQKLLGMPLNAEFFGLPIHMASYSYSIFPIIVAAWVASKVEPVLKKIIPVTVRMIFLPLIEVIVVSLSIILVLGPIVMLISQGLANGIQALYDLSPTISGGIIGGLYQGLVIFGLHWAVIPLVTQDISQTGSSNLNALISATMVAQGGAVLAVFVKTKLPKIKELAGPAAISAFCGVTEPAMYGINLKYGRIFLMASLSAAVGGLITGFMQVNMWAFVGSLIGFTSFVNPEGLDSSFWGFLLASSVTLVMAFTLTYFFGFKDEDVEKGRTVKKVRLGRRDPVAK